MEKRGKMIKKLFINSLIAGVFCLVASPALADYANPPDWESNDYFTHASWEFSETGWVNDPCMPGEQIPVEPNVPLVADGGYLNTNGEPNMIRIEMADNGMTGWSNKVMGPPTFRTGIFGGMFSDVVMTFVIPNDANDTLLKEVWLQVAYWGDSEASGDIVSVEFFADDPNITDPNRLNVIRSSTNIEVLPEIPGSSGSWYRYTGTFLLDQQPTVEYVLLSIDQGACVAVIVDVVDIDTRCIPVRCATPIPGDLNGDCVVDLADLEIMLSHWLEDRRE